MGRRGAGTRREGEQGDGGAQEEAGHRLSGMKEARRTANSLDVPIFPSPLTNGKQAPEQAPSARSPAHHA
ncbi:hypothetical protein MFU01_48470 [Myxococcus fulvus]|uniref:Uncharacterized protein n=1 Tax=Myxococcus fulvus TaxID=33 RepID=A0A511T6K7_MYXFU|nr:hypothetical protein MFU01_48470 [Myxococcus fulvus]